jgi:acetamidase/formamidase
MILPVPFAGKIKDGETVKIECVDWYVFTAAHIKVLYFSHPYALKDRRPDQEQ